MFCCIPQLRERLALFLEDQKEKEERKRDDIIEAKEVTGMRNFFLRLFQAAAVFKCLV